MSSQAFSHRRLRNNIGMPLSYAKIAIIYMYRGMLCSCSIKCIASRSYRSAIEFKFWGGSCETTHGLVGDLSEVEIVCVRQPGSVAVTLRSGSSLPQASSGNVVDWQLQQPVALDLLVLVYRVVWRGTDGSRSCAGINLIPLSYPTGSVRKVVHKEPDCPQSRSVGRPAADQEAVGCSTFTVESSSP